MHTYMSVHTPGPGQTAQPKRTNAMNQSMRKNIMMCSSYLRYLIHEHFFFSSLPRVALYFIRFTHFSLANKKGNIFLQVSWVFFNPLNISFFNRDICIIFKCSLTWISSTGTNYFIEIHFFSHFCRMVHMTPKSSSKSNGKSSQKSTTAFLFFEST